MLKTLFRCYDTLQQQFVYTSAVTSVAAASVLRRKVQAVTGRWNVTTFQKQIINSKGEKVWVNVTDASI